MDEAEFFDRKHEVSVGEVGFSFVLGLRQHHSVVWIDGVPMPPQRARKKVAQWVGMEADRMIRCWPNIRKPNANHEQ